MVSIWTVPVSNWYTDTNWARSNQVPVSHWVIRCMRCLDYFKFRSVDGTRSVIGTLVATEVGQRVIAFVKNEFDLDMNSDPSISTTQHGTRIDAVC